eukprot:TRINITY_DN822_c0_g1_i2.p1 TRINITY_DN822_c0_g1~~TRINITY_DN822_c0_g1_i2.p1  ORF type:complete len:715 (+),score=152.73 TRINITY_DN822_c0_g1_i2:62-2146(+)
MSSKSSPSPTTKKKITKIVPKTSVKTPTKPATKIVKKIVKKPKVPPKPQNPSSIVEELEVPPEAQNPSSKIEEPEVLSEAQNPSSTIERPEALSEAQNPSSTIEDPEVPPEAQNPSPTIDKPEISPELQNPSSTIDKPEVSPELQNPSSTIQKPEVLPEPQNPSITESITPEEQNPKKTTKTRVVKKIIKIVKKKKAASNVEKNENIKKLNLGDRGEGGGGGLVAVAEIAKECEDPVTNEDIRVSERKNRKKAEIFIGGLDRDAKEEDLRKVFEKIGEVVEVRLMMNGQTGKNKGYAFLRFASAEEAKRALTEFPRVEVCGKDCGTAPLESNDKIFLGNIDKKWKREDVIKLLQEIGIENIDTVTVMSDPSNADCNRGFAFLELETNKDAQIAYKKLQKKDVFGKERNIKVAWAEPMNDPDEEEMLKVKSVKAEGIPPSWDEAKVRKYFKKFGEIERVVLARNIQSARRKDFAFVNYTTREAALASIESFDKKTIVVEGSKVKVKVSLAKPISKGKQNTKGAKFANKDDPKGNSKAVKRDTQVNLLSSKGKSLQRITSNIGGGKKSTTTHELIQVLREQASWGQGQIGLGGGSTIQDYTYSLSGGKRPFTALGDDLHYSESRGYTRARLDSYVPVASSSYSTLSQRMAGASLPYYRQPVAGYASDTLYGVADHSSLLQMRQGATPYGTSHYSRY